MGRKANQTLKLKNKIKELEHKIKDLEFYLEDMSYENHYLLSKYGDIEYGKQTTTNK